MNICVFTGANPGVEPHYQQAAEHLGRYIARQGYGLVYGGGSLGLMGTVANAAISNNGTVYGVLPKALQKLEVGNPDISELFIVPDMHTRKAKMAELSDAFIVMPGGIGTMEEMFEVWTWAQLGLHQKPVGILNINNYYDHLLAFLEHTVAQGFLRPEHKSMLACSSEPVELLTKMAAMKPPEVEKWITVKDT